MPTRFCISLVALVLAACGAGSLQTQQQQQYPDGGSSSSASFTSWAVFAGAVTAYELDASMKRGKAVGTATTDSTGAFTLQLTTSSRAQLLLVVSSGTFTEPATGTPINLAGSELTALVPSAIRVSGDSVGGVLISPVSHLIAALAGYYVSQGSALDTALQNATSVLDAHFGALSWMSLSALPDLTTSSTTQVNDAARAAVVLAGLSGEAKNLAVAKNLTPGGPLNSLSLVEALAGDLAGDGHFDGVGVGAARVTVANAYSADGQTMRAALAQGIAAFLTSARNVSSISQSDAQSLMSAIAGDTNSQLFRDGAVGDITPPVIAFVTPTEGSSAHGQVVVDVIATDETAMATFKFTAPAALAGVQPSTGNGGKSLELHATLDVSSLPDGPLELTVAATDTSGNTSANDLNIVVANHGPTINVSSPNANSVVKGSVSIAASASGQNGAKVTGLTLVDFPAGAGGDTLSAASDLQIPWDTTAAPEGSTTLHFQATDDRGGVSDLFVPVSIDNVPFGIVDVQLSAGNAIQGATITVVAIDNKSGAIATTVGPNSGVLGTCGSTNASGFLSCTLNVENYAGSIQVRASGAGLSYVDPSGPAQTNQVTGTVIAIPTTFTFTSYVGNYVTGQHISVPLTLWTTVADTLDQAYVAGVDRAAAAPHSLLEAMPAIDPLFASHLTSVAWDLRGSIPVSLTSSAQSLRDVVYAALPDVALNQLARDKSAAAAVTPGGVITAITLLQSLQLDAAGDGQFDGFGAAAAQLKTAGNPPQALDATWLRYSMAQALDEWFLSAPQNKTGLLSSDLQNTGVFDTIADDTSILFPSNVAPIAYDNAAPTVALTATFTNDNTTNHTPVLFSSQLLVSGTLNVNATASDVSGISSFVVQYQAPGASSFTTLSPASGSTATNILGSIDTTAFSDGPLNVKVAACDNSLNHNCGFKIFAFVVDNTAPTITVEQPFAGSFYSSVVPVQLSVADNQAIPGAPVEQSGTVTLHQSQPGSSTYLGSWTIPSGFEDGPYSFRFDLCDIVFNCNEVLGAYGVDRTPPAVSIVTAPPRYTTNSNVTVVATADDGPLGSGVAGVFAVVQGSTNGPVSGVLNSATHQWTLNVPLITTGQDSIIAVYGVDRAVDANGSSAGANSGFGKATQYQQTTVSMFDGLPPTPQLAPSQPASYFDERSMTVSQTAQPATARSSWTYSAGTLTAVDIRPNVQVGSQVPVHKGVQRLAIGTTAPAISDLTNSSGSSANTPYLAIDVPFIAGQQSPIVAAAFVVTTTCSGCGALPTATGALLAATNSPPAAARFYLPLSSDFIPAFAQIAGTATLTISAAATDAAGNTTPTAQPLGQLLFALDAPPIFAVSELALGADPWAAANMRLSDGSYLAQFAASGTAPSEGERFAKFVIFNPGPQLGLALSVAKDPNDSAHSGAVADDLEQWDDTQSAAYPIQQECICSLGLCTTGYPWLTWNLSGGSPPKCYGSIITSNPYPLAKAATGPLDVAAYLTADGSTPGATAPLIGGYTLVPASSGGSMGMALVYVGRSAGAISRAGFPLSPEGPPQPSWNGAKIISPYATIPDSSTLTTVGDVDCGGGSKKDDCWTRAIDWQKQLEVAQTNLYGVASWTATGFVPSTTTPLGANATTNTTLTSRTVSH